MNYVLPKLTFCFPQIKVFADLAIRYQWNTGTQNHVALLMLGITINIMVVLNQLIGWLCLWCISISCRNFVIVVARHRLWEHYSQHDILNKIVIMVDILFYNRCYNDVSWYRLWFSVAWWLSWFHTQSLTESLAYYGDVIWMTRLGRFHVYVAQENFAFLINNDI